MTYKIYLSIALFFSSMMAFGSDNQCQLRLQNQTLTALHQKCLDKNPATNDDLDFLKQDILKNRTISEEHFLIFELLLKQPTQSKGLLDLLVHVNDYYGTYGEKINELLSSYLIAHGKEDFLFDNASEFFDAFLDLLSLDDKTYPLIFSEHIQLLAESHMHRLLEIKKKFPLKFQSIILLELQHAYATIKDSELAEFSEFLDRSKILLIESAGDPQSREFRINLRQDLSTLKPLISEISRTIASTNIFDFLSVKYLDDTSAKKIMNVLNEHLISNEPAENSLSYLSILVFKYRLLKYLNADLPPRDFLKFFDRSIEDFQQSFSDAPRSSQPSNYLTHLDQGALDQEAAVQAMAKDPYFKFHLFSQSQITKELHYPQRWMTIADPEIVKLQFSKLSEKQKMLVCQKLKISISDLQSPEYFEHYADEILKAISGLHPEENKNEIVLQFVSRRLGDLDLGSACGDCTAVQSVNFGKSVSWFYNPSYQILTFSKGKRFLGKMNLGLAELNQESIVLIDALEFNPQAKEGLPYHDDALEGFKKALAFVQQFAASEKRQLIALIASNSSRANDMIKSYGSNRWPNKKGLFQFPLDEKAIRSSINVAQNIKIEPYFQSVERASGAEGPSVQVSEAPKDPALFDLENYVLNPAQIKYPEIAKELRSLRDTADETFRSAQLKKLSLLILNDPIFLKEIQRIYRLPHDTAVGWKFISTRLTELYLKKSTPIAKAGVLLILENFVKIPVE